MNRCVIDAKTGIVTQEILPDPPYESPAKPASTEAEVLDDLIDLLVAQGVITNV